MVPDMGAPPPDRGDRPAVTDPVVAHLPLVDALELVVPRLDVDAEHAVRLLLPLDALDGRNFVHGQRIDIIRGLSSVIHEFKRRLARQQRNVHGLRLEQAGFVDRGGQRVVLVDREEHGEVLHTRRHGEIAEDLGVVCRAELECVNIGAAPNAQHVVRDGEGLVGRVGGQVCDVDRGRIEAEARLVVARPVPVRAPLDVERVDIVILQRRCRPGAEFQQRLGGSRRQRSPCRPTDAREDFVARAAPSAVRRDQHRNVGHRPPRRAVVVERQVQQVGVLPEAADGVRAQGDGSLVDQQLEVDLVLPVDVQELAVHIDARRPDADRHGYAGKRRRVAAETQHVVHLDGRHFARVARINVGRVHGLVTVDVRIADLHVAADINAVEPRLADGRLQDGYRKQQHAQCGICRGMFHRGISTVQLTGVPGTTHGKG